MNPIISKMQMQNPMIAMMQPLYAAMNGGQSIMSVLGQMASRDERMQMVVDTIRQNGGIQQAVYAEARQRNADPTDVLNQARQMLQTFNMK